MKNKCKIVKNISFCVLIVFTLVGVTSCKRIPIEPITTVAGHVYCVREAESGGIRLQAGADLGSAADSSGQKDVTVTSNVSLSYSNVRGEKWGCYGAGVYKRHLITVGVHGDPSSLENLARKYVECGQRPIPATVIVRDTNNNGFYNENVDHATVSYDLPNLCSELDEEL